MSDNRAAALVCLAVAIAMGAPVLLQDEPTLLTTFHDDAFYYLQVARNLAGGAGFTFDGIHRTNGFHPLWLLLVTPVYLFEPGEVVALRIVALMETILTAGAAGLIVITLRRRIDAGAAAAAALLVVVLPGAREAFRYGMEGSLILFLLVLVWNRWLAVTGDDGGSIGRWLALGGACALAFLARLEAGLIVPIMLVGFRQRLRPRRIALVGLVTPVAAAVLIYLLWNRIGFDLWLPVSGMIKAYHASHSPNGWLHGLWEIPWPGHQLICRLWGRTLLRDCPAPAQWLHAALIAAMMAIIWWRRRALTERVRLAGIGLPLMIAAGMVVADVRLVHYLYPWARVPIYLATALIVGALLHRHGKTARRVAVGLGLAAAVVVPLRALAADDPSTHYPVYRALAARWIDEHLPADHRIGSWNAGTLGYFAHRPVVNLDGLVNDAAYFEQVIKRNDLEGYLRTTRIQWLADQACGPDPRPASYLKRTGSESLDDRFELAASFYNLEAKDGCPGFAIWKLNPGP